MWPIVANALVTWSGSDPDWCLSRILVLMLFFRKEELYQRVESGDLERGTEF